MGSKNHEVVPSPLLASLSGLRGGQVNKCIGELAKRKLLAKVIGMKCERYPKNCPEASHSDPVPTDDGYRLTYGGYDFLAMRTFAKRDVVQSVGNQIGTGKESDIYVVANPEGERMALKIHRLGRISFRTIKSKRDYLRQGQHASWMYMSRLAAMKEYAFMRVRAVGRLHRTAHTSC
jgi:RIO kinase 2